MIDQTQILHLDESVEVHHYANDTDEPSKHFEILQDPIVGDWQVSERVGEGGGGMYVETRDGAMQYALQRCGVIENGEWTRAPERC